MMDEILGESFSRNFREKKELYWRQVSAERKSNHQMEFGIGDEDGHILTDGEDVDW